MRSLHSISITIPESSIAICFMRTGGISKLSENKLGVITTVSDVHASIGHLFSRNPLNKYIAAMELTNIPTIESDK